MKTRKRTRFAAAMAALSTIFLIGCGGSGDNIGYDRYPHQPGGPHHPGGCAPLNGVIGFSGQLMYTGTELKGGHVRQSGQRLGVLNLGSGAAMNQHQVHLSRNGVDANIGVTLLNANPSAGGHTPYPTYPAQPGYPYPPNTGFGGTGQVMFNVQGYLQLSQTRLAVAMQELGYSQYWNNPGTQFPGFPSYPGGNPGYPGYPNYPGNPGYPGGYNQAPCVTDMAIDVDVYNGTIWNGGVLLYTQQSNYPIYLYF